MIERTISPEAPTREDTEPADSEASITRVTAGLEELAADYRRLHESVRILQREQREQRESMLVLEGRRRAVVRENQRLRARLPERPVSEPDSEPDGGWMAPSAAPGVTPFVLPTAVTAPPSAEAVTYAVFEDAFRGSPTEIANRQRRYLSNFEGASDVLDIGCGRGEFLELLRDRRITARGIDANAEMIERCRERGLDVTQADALAYVAGLPAESLGGLFAAQVVEHLEADYLLRLLADLHRALRPGARIVLETINPASWSAFFSAYIRDITHRHPLHPDTLGYLLRAQGFVDVEIIYSAPVPDAGRLQRVSAAAGLSPTGDLPRGLIETFNQNVDHLNDLLFADQDYAAVGTRA